VLVIVYSIASGIAFWDWLEVLLIPAANKGAVAPLFARAQNRNAQVIAEPRAQDDALQAYLIKWENCCLRKA
jgi:hypothetical protein